MTSPFKQQLKLKQKIHQITKINNVILEDIA